MYSLKRDFPQSLITAAFLSFFLLSACGILKGQDLQLRQLNPRTVLVSGGPQNINITAFRTESGIVVVDTGSSEAEGKEARKLIEEAFQGMDFAYIINTHSHWDHISGNSVFPEARIVAHQRCRDVIEKKGEGPERPQAGGAAPENSIEELTAEKDTDMPPPPPPTGTIWFEGDKYDLTVPDITFEDSLSLYCGDTTFRLLYFGEAHTVSDIVILVPEAGFLLAGDLFFHNWLPVFSEWIQPDIRRWEVARKQIFSGTSELETVIPGHGPLMKAGELEKQLDYRIKLWESVEKAADDGSSLDAVLRRLSIEGMFPDLAAANIKDSRGRAVHDENIRAIFTMLKTEKTQ